MTEIFQIAIDGPVASGKGTVARLLAKHLGYLCLDTGAVYRGIACHFIDNDIDINDTAALIVALKRMKLSVKCIEGSTSIFLDEQDITKRIRDNLVSTYVFKIAKLPEVRLKVRSIQYSIAKENTLVCEGRDITSVVFPRARFKFFLTAKLKVRAIRRHAELIKKGEDIRLERVIDQIYDRDKADKNREKSPLKRVKDAIKIDSSKQDAYSVVRQMEKIIRKGLMKENNF